MKLRQKLAVVLASAMVVTAVPVVTMAASTNSLVKETIKVAKDDITTANSLKIDFKDASQGDTEVFYLELENAEWDFSKLAVEKDGDKYTFANGTVYELQSDEVVKVTYKVGSNTKEVFPIAAKTTGGDAKISIVTKGGSTVSQGSFVFATTADKKVSYTIGDLNSFYKSGKLADITFEETYKGALAGDKAVIRLELADSDWVFDYADGAEVEVKGLYGFSNQTVKATVNFPSSKDKGAIDLTIDAREADTAATIGSVKVKELAVRCTSKNPEEGKLVLDIKGDDLVKEGSDVEVANVSKYGTYIKMKDDKAVDIVAGRVEDVEFTIGEAVEDSLVGGREFEMTLDNGHFDYKNLLKDYGKEGDKLVNDEKDHYKSVELDVKKLMKADLIKDATFKLDKVDTDLITKIYFDEDEDGEIIPETLIVELDKNAQINKEEDKMTFKLPVCVAIGNKDKESVTVKASGRALENEVSVKAVTIINPFNVTSEQAVLKVGLQGQVSGTITLTETDKEMFSKGKVTFSIKDKDEEVGIYLTDCTVETSGGIKGTKSEVKEGKKGNVEVTLNRNSKEAASITLKDMKFTTDRTVPEGTYDLEIKGEAIDADGHKLTIKDFIKISTSNTQDITASGLAKGTAKFVIGESKYTLNDKEVTMDAPSYIQDPGYTMVPVRYVAQAFGVAESDILFGKGTVTLFAGERTISLTAGSNIAVVNGNNVAMATKVVIKDGRTFVPAGQIASLLGIKSTWDSASKTATFENN